jgi:hypothetical protein
VEEPFISMRSSAVIPNQVSFGDVADRYLLKNDNIGCCKKQKRNAPGIE